MPNYPAAYKPGSKAYGGKSGLSKDEKPKKGFLPPPPPAIAPPPVLPPPPPAVVPIGPVPLGAGLGLGLALGLAGVGTGLVVGLETKKIIDAFKKAKKYKYHTDLSEEELMQLYGEESMDMSTWTLECDLDEFRCSSAATAWYAQVHLLSAGGCQNNCSLAPDPLENEWPRPVPDNVNRVVRARVRVSDRMDTITTWSRNASSENPYTGPVYWPLDPWSTPFVYPSWFWPWEAPIFEPAPLPQKMPWKPPLPGQQPTNPEFKPEPKPHPKAKPKPGAKPGFKPAPAPKVWPLTPGHFPWPITVIPAPFRPRPGDPWIVPTVPDIIIEPGVRPAPDVSPRPGPVVGPVPGPGPRPSPDPAPAAGGVGHWYRNPSARNKPPEKGTKERKLNIRTVAGRAWIAVNFATETLDLVDALWDAIPKHLRSKSKWYGGQYRKVSTRRRMLDIWENLDEIDMSDAMENIINNQFEDFVYGMQGRVVGKATRNLNISTGLNRALRSAQKQTGVIPELPEFHYDQDTGEVWLTGGSFGGRLDLPKPGKGVFGG